MLIPIIHFSDDITIKQIRLSFTDHTLVTIYYFNLWSVLCFLLFINAINMFDGINFQVGLYSIYLSLFFILNNYLLFFCFILIGLVTFIILNYQFKSFLGDSELFISIYFGYFFIKMYNQTDFIKLIKLFFYDYTWLGFNQIIYNKNFKWIQSIYP